MGLEQPITSLAFSIPQSTASPPPGFELAFAAILITIMAGGIAFGVGMAIRSRRLSDIGKEELLAAVINSALLGAFLALIALINGVYLDYSSSYAATGSGALANCTAAAASVSSLNISAAPMASYFASCEYSTGAQALQNASNSLLQSQVALGYLSSITLNLPGADISPFSGFGSVLSSLSQASAAISAFFAAASLYSSVFSELSNLAMAIGLPAGFLLRAFYPTRRLGSLLLALSFAIIAVLSLCAIASSASVENAIFKAGQVAGASSALSDYAAPAMQADPNDSGFYTTVRSMFASGQLTSYANALAGAAWSLVSYCALAFAILPLISVLLSLSFSWALAGALELDGLSSIYKYS